jgi:hypothetical protein
MVALSRTDPERSAAHVYYDTPPDEHIICLDEKTDRQALERRYADLPMRPGQPVRREFEHIRRGTLTLMGAFDVRRGKLFGLVSDDHNTLLGDGSPVVPVELRERHLACARIYPLKQRLPVLIEQPFTNRLIGQLDTVFHERDRLRRSSVVHELDRDPVPVFLGQGLGPLARGGLGRCEVRRASPDPSHTVGAETAIGERRPQSRSQPARIEPDARGDWIAERLADVDEKKPAPGIVGEPRVQPPRRFQRREHFSPLGQRPIEAPYDPHPVREAADMPSIVHY